MHDLLERDAADEVIGQAGLAQPPQELMNAAAPYISVDRQSAPPQVGERKRQVCGDERLAFLARRAGDGDHDWACGTVGVAQIEANQPEGLDHL